MNEFQINFDYQNIAYAGLVTPFTNANKTSYKINLEGGNQEDFVEIIGEPSSSVPGDWDFACTNGSDPQNYYDKNFLMEIGEAIEKQLTSPE